MVIASSSFIVIGITGFTLKVSNTLASPERRNVLASKVKRDHQRRSREDVDSRSSCLPSLQALTDSPGVKLRYRLAEQSGQRLPVVLSSLFAVAWNTLLAVLFVIAVQNVLSGKSSWFLIVLLVPFAAVRVIFTRWFFRLLGAHAGLGPTAVEISDLPLLPGRSYQVYLCQYGKTRFAWLRIRLVGYEEAIYQQGTDIRTERSEFASIEAFSATSTEKPDGIDQNDNVEQSKDSDNEQRLSAVPENPLELDCQILLPDDMMHSFYGMHNSVRWKIVVEGEATTRPMFCRSFPVVVYPRDAQ